MKKIKDERGYTLFTALLIAILFTVLAMALLSITMSGLAKNISREEFVQARELSEKGLLGIVSKIHHELNKEIQKDPPTESDFINKLNAALDKYSCTGGTKVGGASSNSKKDGKFEACIETDHPARDRTQPRQVITFKSKGIVNGREQTLETQVLIGAIPGPEELKYAVSTFKRDECTERQSNCMAGEGNLFLHGGVTVEGDVKVDGNLIVAEKSYTPARNRDYRIIQGDVFWVDSTLPILKNSNLILGGDVYKYKNPDGRDNKVTRYQNHINRTNFNTSDYEKITDRLHEAFFDSTPELVQKEVKRNDIEITQEINNFAYTPESSDVREVNSGEFELFEGHRTFKDLNYPNEKLYGYFCPPGLIYNCFLNVNKTYTGEFYLVGRNNNFHKFAVREHLHIGREIFDDRINVTIHDRAGEKGGIYVGGSSNPRNNQLKIGKGLVLESLKVFDRSPSMSIGIDGNLYVDGDLEITDVNGEFNSIIYVNGDVTIDHSRFRGLQRNGRERSLIIFATGKIEFIKNNIFQNTPSEIRGYFYSQERIEIYTSASNLKIYGGLSAPKIVLNSTRGRAGTSYFFGIVSEFRPFQKHGVFIFETKANQLTRPSRLQVVYDPEILETYSDLNPGELKVYNLEQPEILERTTN